MLAISSGTRRARKMKFGHNLHLYMTDVLAGTDLGLHPQGHPQAQEGQKVLENAVLRPCHPEFWSCEHEFWVFWSAY